MSLSSNETGNWFTQTFHQTVDYWSQDNAAADAADALSWGATQVKDKTVEVAKDISTAATDGINAIFKKIVTFLIVIAIAWIAFKGAGSYVTTQATRAAKK